MIKKVLIANRGEIAVRIIRACREMGIETVAVCSEADRNALHAMLADQTICIGPAPSSESYLNIGRIISATITSGADAIHPGFGFLSEDAKFARICERCNITFIGPTSDMIAASGNKAQAKKTMMDAGVPTIPGSAEAVTSVSDGLRLADIATYPVMIKASLGGGGKGMRVAKSSEAFESAFLTAQSEAKNAFGDDSMYIEHYVEHPKHIEVQILADKFGNVIHLGERDCSIQRNHQKLIEETPCEVLTEDKRREICEAAVRAAKAVNYENAGTCEFLLEPSGNFYFMEMNTRIQVEHPITEWVTGIDLIKEQIRIASGEKLEYTQDDITLNGHSIEVRINAEDPEHKFRPCPGKIESVYLPGGKGVRIDSAVYSGLEIPPYYDSMLAKLSVWAPTREEAIRKAQTALGEVIITGIKTNVDYQYGILTDKDFVEGNTDIDFIDKHSRK
ncbi:MAG: acetyl-CoA carboxylase biotin carboxylase subunit [Clostridiales bacterium]|jgi:acetyl-CoA carboxylase biotin carboxylase subunit|nr:acetyl-CoA carboxylase biotin carboxylase subunit [Clostridiales bacterium]